MESILEVKNIEKKYNSGRVCVLNGIDLTVQQNDFIAIMGRSGGGKSTLLRILGLIDKPTSGKITFQGEDSDDLWISQLADIRRRKTGFVYQDARLMDCLTVEQNIKLPLILDKKSAAFTTEKLREQTTRFAISSLLKKHPAQLSGGEKQRTALCRALISNPDLILADEPTGSLDSQSGQTVIDALTELNASLGKTIIMVTHDPQIASFSKKVIFLKDGLIMHTITRDAGDKTKTRELFFKQILEQVPEL